jgi:RimJ/RimL family protein N-acetyltransferase
MLPTFAPPPRRLKDISNAKPKPTFTQNIGHYPTCFRPKAAYDTTVETSIYCAPEATGRGLGRCLYSAHFASIADEDIHRIVAGYTLPNPRSAALHQSFGFQLVGVLRMSHGRSAPCSRHQHRKGA